MNCPSYKVGNITGTTTCVTHNNSTDEYIVDPSKCSLGSNCISYNIKPQEDVNCTVAGPDQFISYQKFPGEKCRVDKDCGEYTTGVCKNNKCGGMAEGVAFNATYRPADYYCNPGLYYNGTACVKQLSTGAKCNDTLQCQNDAVCENNTQGEMVCQKIYSVKNKDNIYDCSSSGVSNLCEEGYCTKSGKTSTCVKADSHTDYTKECSGDTDCSNTQTSNSKCVCGLSGTSYCTLYHGDGPRMKAFELLKEWYYDYSQNCNTGRRNKDDCKADFWGDDYLEYNYYATYAGNFPLVYNADDSVVEVFRKDYYDARNDYEDVDENNSASSIYLSLLGFILS
mmetsp:Transcript_1413/g.2245  ORF Transcript_1413/g.2245 Transcript_1413/m.2245 type:complete len:338 (-) Transcript_1413:2556-3569(-)